MNKASNWIIFGVVVSFLLVFGLSYFTQPIVSAQGQSSLDAQPDQISVYISIQTRNSSLQDAQKSNSDITRRVVQSLVRIGFDEGNISISSYNNYPWTEWENQSSINKGFIVDQQLIVKTNNFKQVYDIVGKVIDSGASISSINFELSQDRQNYYKTQAIQLASEDARQKAMSLAKGQGKNLGALVSLNADDFNYLPRPYYAADASGAQASEGTAMMAKQAALNINPESLKVTSSVNVEYRLNLF